MSKYIIELKDDVQMVQKVGVAENGNAFVMNFYKDQLEELNSDYINEHFGELQDEAYQKGFEDGKAQREHDDKIEVGDEVVDSSGEKGLVVSDGNKCSDTIWLLINGYRVPQSVCKEDYTKTGRHFDIESILEAMKA